MRLRPACLAVLALSLCACLDRPEPAAETGAQAPGAPGASFEFAIGTGEASAFPLAPGSFISGSLPAHDGSAPTALAVQIGNFANTSDGELAVELCRAEQCAKGKASLVGSVDNAYLEVPLSREIDASTSDAPFRYRIIKSGGSQPVAIWLYPLPASQESPKANDQAALDRTPKLAIR